MHISDGVLSTPVWVGSYIVSAVISAVTIRKLKAEQIPKTAIMTSVFFVGSLVSVPFGPTSVHLVLNGLTGIILRPVAFVSILLGLFLQALLFQHGGLTTIGANSITIGLPAFLAWGCFSFSKRSCSSLKISQAFWAGLSAGAAILASTVILAVFLVTTGDEFITIARYAVIAHLPVMIVETLITGFIVSFLVKVKPEILENNGE